MFMKCGDITVHVQIEGPEGAPPLLLLHSLGTNLHVWDEQAAVLARSFRVIRPDLRGHGLTGATPGDYSMAMLAADAAALLDALKVGRAHVGGISIGGMIAQSFAAAHPERAASLILCDTAMAIPPVSTWEERIARVRAEGIAPIADAVMARWVTPGFQDSPEAQGLRAMLLRTTAEGYAGCAAAIRDADLAASTSRLRVPALVLVGDQDQATPVSSAEALRDAIPGAGLIVIEQAAHIPTVEKPAEITEAMLRFLSPGHEDRYEAGLAVRKAVLGEAHVARSLANATAFDRDFQRFITEMAWGSVWTRPGLDRRTRSLLTLAITAALGREEEFKLHLRATRNTGASEEDVAEALMHMAVYAGVPAANAAFRMAKQVFREMEE
ncbi:MAG TPA: 3-oxoadipate enol-lactonase [Acetobacteraceae bacterium]|nr:3-oxoadipate enol-lactonase [Acetobacteraceae bacterium]